MQIINIEKSLLKVTDFYFKKQSEYEYIITSLSIFIFLVCVGLALTKSLTIDDVILLTISSCVLLSGFSAYYLIKLNSKVDKLITDNLGNEEAEQLITYLNANQSLLSNKKSKKLDIHVKNLTKAKEQQKISIDILLPLVTYVKKIQKEQSKIVSV